MDYVLGHRGSRIVAGTPYKYRQYWKKRKCGCQDCRRSNAVVRTGVVNVEGTCALGGRHRHDD